MNDFVVRVNSKVKQVKVVDFNIVIIDGKEIQVELSKINNYSYLLRVGNKVYEITTNKLNLEKYRIFIDGNYFETIVRTKLQEKAKELLSKKEKYAHHDIVKAPMPGLVLGIKKKVGDSVELGESLIVLEAMKMENDIRSPASGIIKEIFSKEGASVEKGESILKIE
jgi:biotin carboxyl carrier protein